MKNIQFTYKLKLILIVSLGLILSYLVYNKKIKSTIDRVQKINNLNESTENDETNLNNSLQFQLTKKNEIEGMLSSNTESSSFESDLIDEITKFNTKINISNVSDIYHYKDGNYSISSLNFTLKNDFKTTLKLIDHIEKKLKKVTIISVNYYSKKINYNSSKKQLYATIYIQNIKNS